MLYSTTAALVLLAHLAFVLFVVFGAALVVRWPRMAWLHLPAAFWGIFIELSGRGCPLTTLENLLRLRAGAEGYAESFIEHYVLWLLYPGGLTREVQFILAGLVAAINLILYAWVWRRRAAKPRARDL